MIQTTLRRAACGLFVMLAGPGIARAEETILFSSDFSTDDTSYFSLQEEFSYPDPIELVWDPTRGSPAPGSLRTVVPDLGQAVALGECLPVHPTAIYHIQADVLKFSEVVSPPACVMSFRAYTEAGCAGESGQVPGASPQTGFDWEFVEFDMGPLGDDFWFSVRAVLVERNPLNGMPASCNFDNLQISLLTPAEVPAGGRVGTAVFIVFTAWLGAFLLSRIRR